MHARSGDSIELRGRKVAVVGLGRTNLALVRFLLRRGARVTAMDEREADELGPALEQLRGLPVDLELGAGYLDSLEGYQVVFLTPGMRKDLPQVRAARDAGALVTGEVPLFLRLCRSTVVGVTGSAGKTTTTALTGLMLSASGIKTTVGGNIGTPLIDAVDSLGPDETVVLELSSFQLELCDRSPDLGALLNVTPNHLDIHPSMEHYVDAKRNVFRYQTRDDACAFNLDDGPARELAGECRSRVRFFTTGDEAPDGVCVKNGAAWFRRGGSEERLFDVGSLRLRGRHNLSNALCAALLAAEAGARPEAIGEAVCGFAGLEHRLEPAGEVEGVSFYNDSIATAPSRTIAALDSFEEPVVLIAGGYDKKLPFDELAARISSRVKALVLIGRTAGLIEERVTEASERRGEGPSIVRARDLEAAVGEAFEAASPGDVVLMSPACASYDMFENYEERGRVFKLLVSELAAGKRPAGRRRSRFTGRGEQ